MDQVSRALMVAGGGIPYDPIYIEDVFGTYLYTGTNAYRGLTLGVPNLAERGALLWFKSRDSGASDQSHKLYDTARASDGGSFLLASPSLITNSNSLSQSGTNVYVVKNRTDGYIEFGGSGGPNEFDIRYAAYIFRRQPKFFDVVTWTGDGGSRTISHSLGSTPGCIIIKQTSGSGVWNIWHRSLGTNGGLPNYHLFDTAAQYPGSGQLVTGWNSTGFSIGGGNSNFNGNGQTYVAYLFAHDAGGFGLTGTDNVISCGAYTGNGDTTTGQLINLGYEAQWVLIKNSNSSGTNWWLVDAMRGWQVNGAFGGEATFFPNTTNGESNQVVGEPASTGFRVINDNVNQSGQTYTYIAIRRGPHKTPATGTSVFMPAISTGTGATKSVDAGWPVDTFISTSRSNYGGLNFAVWDRLRGTNSFYNRVLRIPTTLAEESGGEADVASFDQLGVTFGDSAGWGFTNAESIMYVHYFFRRAPGFFDVVCYRGTGNSQAIAHSLNAVPRLIIVKSRSSGGVGNGWTVRYLSPSNLVTVFNGWTSGLQSNAAASGTDVPNTSSFDITATSFDAAGGGYGYPNMNGTTYVAYLFASCPGVSSVGTYTGNGSSQTINCGFTGGARFVLIKRTDNTGDWYVWDTSRGIVAGNDPRLSLNFAASEQTSDDSIDPDSTGFVVNQVAATNINVSTANYLYLAIA